MDSVYGNDRVVRNSTSLDECKATCVDSYQCVAIDWEPDDARNSCWILTSTTAADGTSSNTTRYELKRACLPGQFCAKFPFVRLNTHTYAKRGWSGPACEDFKRAPPPAPILTRARGHVPPLLKMAGHGDHCE